MSEERLTLKEVTGDDISNNGIFAFIRNSLSEVPDYLSDVVSLNIGYYYNHSGNKLISELVSNELGDDTTLTNDANYNIARLIVLACKTNWDKLYNSLTIDYSPIENVDETYTETITDKGTNTDSGTDNHLYGGNDTVTNSGTDSTQAGGTDKTTNTGTVTDSNENKDGTSETINGIAGYNSEDYSKDTKSTTTVNQTITDTRTDNLDESTTYGRTDTRTLDTKQTTDYNNTDNESISLTHSKDNTTTTNRRRHGNIGVTTNQQMIEAEIELRKKYFIDMMYRDCDRFLTLKVY